MPRVRRNAYKTFDLDYPCPSCGHKITPAEINHIDGTNIRCPACQAEFKYVTHKPQMTS